MAIELAEISDDRVALLIKTAYSADRERGSHAIVNAECVGR